MTLYRHQQNRRKRGMTLVEMSLVIGLLLAMVSGGFYISGKVGAWRLGRDAAEDLRTVYAAQRMYLADNPTTPVASLTPEMLIPYLPRGATALPTVTALDDAELSILVTVSPPVVDGGNGTPYDPSKSSSDGLWDVGK